jgi:hypothetical protein
MSGTGGEVCQNLNLQPMFSSWGIMREASSEECQPSDTGRKLGCVAKIIFKRGSSSSTFHQASDPGFTLTLLTATAHHGYSETAVSPRVRCAQRR